MNVSGRITRCASLIRRLRLASLVILVGGDDKRKSLSFAALTPGLFYFPRAYDSELSTLRENKKARHAEA